MKEGQKAAKTQRLSKSIGNRVYGAPNFICMGCAWNSRFNMGVYFSPTDHSIGAASACWRTFLYGCGPKGGKQCCGHAGGHRYDWSIAGDFYAAYGDRGRLDNF